MRAGEVYVNTASGERVLVILGTSETDGKRLVVDLFLKPNGGMLGRHNHPHLHETFKVISGNVAFTLNGERKTACCGEIVDIPRGTVHDFWNQGTSVAVVRVAVEPAIRFVEMIRNGYGLAQDGKTDSKGMPGLLQVALFAKEFEDVIRYNHAPQIVQRILFCLLSPFAKLKGLKGSYPEYLTRPASEFIPLKDLSGAGI
jgi:quercetin dioxygenase-like cupin family protein